MLHWCRLLKRCQNLPAWHCGTVVQTVSAVSESTCRALRFSGADCLSGVRTYLLRTVLQWCRLFKRCRNLPAGHCVTVVLLVKQCQYLPTGHYFTVMQTVLAMSEPTSRTLCDSVAGCVSGVRTYLPGTVLHWCRLFKQCQNLPAWHCVTVIQTVKAVSEPTYQALCYSGADCFSNVRTYLPSTVLQTCRLYKPCQNLPTGHCVTVVQTVLAMSEPTYPALCYRGAGCISGVGTYLPGTVLQWCRLFKQCQNLPAGHCVTVVQTVLAMSEPTYWTLCYSDADCFSNVRTYLPGTVLQ